MDDLSVDCLESLTDAQILDALREAVRVQIPPHWLDPHQTPRRNHLHDRE